MKTKNSANISLKIKPVRPLNNKAFVLVSLILQLPLILMLIHFVFYLLLAINLNHQIKNICYIESLEQLQRQQVNKNSLILKLQSLLTQFNLKNWAVLEVQLLNLNSNYTNSSDVNSHQHLVYTLNLKYTLNLLLKNWAAFEAFQQCGAEKKCQNQNCQYGIIMGKL